MTYLQRQHFTIALGVALCIFVPNTVLAEGELEEVVVTAQKRTQNLQDVPVAVSSLPSICWSSWAPGTKNTKSTTLFMMYWATWFAEVSPCQSAKEKPKKFTSWFPEK